MNDRRGYRSGNMGMGMGMGPSSSRWDREELGMQDRSRGSGDYGYGGREREGHDEGLWDRMRGGMREGWEALGGDEDRRFGEGRDYGRYDYGRDMGHLGDESRRYGMRGYGGSGYGQGRGMGGYGGSGEGSRGSGFGGNSYGGSLGSSYGRSGSDMGWGSMRGQHEDIEPSWVRDRNERGGSFWDRARHEMREGWESVKETFSGKGPKGYKRSDERIREDVCDRLARHPAVDASEIEVQVKDGEVTLSGSVNERRMKRVAEDIVEDIDGVHDVSNHIRVLRSSVGVGIGQSGQIGQESRRDTTRDNGIVSTGTSGTRSGANATSR